MSSSGGEPPASGLPRSSRVLREGLYLRRRRQGDDRRQMITGDQVKTAREMLGWSLPRLASRARSVTEIRKLDSGRHRPADTKIVSIQHALEAAGVEFTNGGEPGVKLKAKLATRRETWDPP